MKHTLNVSVVITCYNYAEYVEEAIESILAQTHNNINLIIIDDGSTDNSLEVIKKYQHNDKVEVVSRKNKGIVYTRNEALKLSKGEFIFFLDADDFFDNDYIEKMVDIAQEYNADVVYPNWRVFGDEQYEKKFPEFDLQRLVRQEIHCTSESLIRRSAIGNHKFESEKVAEDWDFFLGMALDSRKFKLAAGCYINYRVRKGGRGTASPYWDDMYHFYKILQKWNKRYPGRIKPEDLPIYAGRLRDDHISALNDIIHEKDQGINEARAALASQELTIGNLNQELQLLHAELQEIKDSRSYKAGKILQKPIAHVRNVKMGIKKRLARSYARDVEDIFYDKELRNLTSSIAHGEKRTLAVVVHLFYSDNWPLFTRKIKLLPEGSYDLFITLPAHNEAFTDTIHQDFPDARIIKSPNRGRDVLPFIKVARVLQKLNYKVVLKFHSKKSTHRQDGQDWLESMLDQIIPDNQKVLQRILKTVAKDNFGVLGPADVYYPLTINFPANGEHMTRIITRLFDKDTAFNVLQKDRNKYGFFGGTMFWLNLEASDGLFDYSASQFEPEAGQIDATFAHALERMFCIVPEIRMRDIYESNGDQVRKRSYVSGRIPDWSKDHNK